MGLFARGNQLGDSPGQGVNDADSGIQGIQAKDWVRRKDWGYKEQKEN